MTNDRFDASRASGAMQVEHCDIPVGMTLCEWRRCGGAVPNREGDGLDGGAPPPAAARRRTRTARLRRALGRK